MRLSSLQKYIVSILPTMKPFIGLLIKQDFPYSTKMSQYVSTLFPNTESYMYDTNCMLLYLQGYWVVKFKELVRVAHSQVEGNCQISHFN